MRMLLLAIVLAGCVDPDPLSRPGLWHPTGANDTNLRAMIVDPNDLVNGQASTLGDGRLAADAVERYRSGKLLPLPDSGVAKIQPVGFGSSSAAQPAASN